MSENDTPQAPRRLSIWVAVIPAVAVAVLLTLGTPLILGQDDSLPSTLIDRPAPRLVTEPIEGLPHATDALLRDGRPKLVNFWASWCAPCRIEHPFLMQIAESGIPIIGLNYKDEDANALKFLADLGNPFAAAGSVEGRMAIEWGVYGVPETFVIDSQGKVRLRIAGPITPVIYEKQLKPVLDSLR